MQALVGLADDLAARFQASYADFLAELDERASAQHAPTVEGVTLASLHAAKGLEWDAVFLAGLSEGLMPISLAETDAAIAEERRLLYVGITRAREHLELSFARARNPGGRATRRRSRFLDGLWPEHAAAPSGARGRTPRGGHLTGEFDAGLYDRLAGWRSSVAVEAGLPAFTVLVDRTLEAIAELRPSTMPELAAIKGMGPAKLSHYGETILAIVAAPDGATDGSGTTAATRVR